MPPLLEPLTKDQEDLILADVSYQREQLEQDVKQLREWLNDQQHLPPSRLKEKDCFLKSYLIGGKGSLETAKRKLDAYYTFRRYTELLEDRDPLGKEYSKPDTNHIAILPQISKSTEFVFATTSVDPEPKNYNYLQNIKRIVNLFELKMRMPENMASSLCFIVDMKILTPGHMVMISPILIRDILHILQNILPFRIKGMIFVNAPAIMEIALNNLMKPFMSKKLKERFHIFSAGYEQFHKFIDREVLPKEYGGDLEMTIKELNDAWKKKEVEERDWFVKELSELTDESKRIKTENNILIGDPFFGVHGSLKKLVVD